jgi:uncharacterized repeat protein (TIGR02543 family)
MGSNYYPSANTTLYAIYTANNYNITFDSNASTGTASTGSMAQEPIVAGTAKALIANAFSRIGYVFNGWNTAANGSGAAYADLTNVTFYGNTTLYAQWLVTITYDGNGKGSGTVPAAVNVVPGATTTLAGISTTLIRTNYTFAGWNTQADGSGTSYLYGASGFTTNAAITLYAQWNSTITFNANGSTSGSVPASQTAIGSTPINLASNSGSLAKTGFFFAGWNTLANGTGAAYPQTSPYVSSGNVTLYAQWVSACVTSSSSSGGYKILTFSGVGLCYWTVPAGVTSIDTLIVGGGGGGGSNLSGGGGGGQVVRINGVSVSGGYFIYVGPGGAGGTGGAGPTDNGQTGSRSYIDLGTSLAVALGGNGGRGRYTAPVPTGGYTGGGGTYYDSTYPTTKNPNTGSGGVGFDGGVGGISGAGGGGAGGPGYSSGNGTGLTAAGGVGLADSITGTSTYYGGGGGAAKYGTTTSWTGLGGLGGGGQGGGSSAGTGAGGAGSNGLGGGGGGDYGGVAGGAGGSGVVIIRYTATYTVTFNVNGAATGAPSAITVSQALPAASVTLATVGSMLKSGYTFAGWDTSNTTTTASYASGAAITPADNITLYAVWSPNSYAITFNANGGTGTLGNEAIVAGTAIALSANAFGRTGYTFVNWNTAANGTGTSYANLASVTLYGNLTLYAQWLAGTYSISFGSNTASGCIDTRCTLAGQPGQSMPSQTFVAGTAFTLSPNLWYKTGYTFAGWSASNGVQSVLYTDAQSVTFFGNISIYAQWTPNVYVITYSPNGGSGTASIASQNYTYGAAAITTFPTVGTMVKSGYSFAGWSATAGGTTPLTTLTPAAFQTLYAIWTPNPYVVTFIGNSSTGGSTAAQTINAGTSTSLTANGFTRTGYSFAGWNTSADGTGTTSYTNTQTATVYSALSLYAQWTILNPSVPTISVAGGNGIATVSITSSETNTATAGAPSSYTITAYAGTTAISTCTVIPTATSCIVTGLTNGTAYTFKAFATNTTGSATSVASAAITPAPYTVTYNAGVGTVTTTSTNTTFNVGTPVTLPTPTANGYTFTGWFTAATGGSFVGSPNSTYSPASSLTLYATWTAISYTITYSANGGSGSVANGTFTTGGIAYPIAAGSGLSKSGYNFAGWTTAADGTGTAYPAATNYSTSAALDLYAKWTAINQTITYAANTGTGIAPTQTSLTIGQTFTVAAGSVLSKSGYTFSGWFDGTNTYQPGATYTIGTTTVTLIAQWTPIQYVVTYAANGGTGSVPVDVTHAATSSVTVLAAGALSRAGYTFAGWSDGTTTYQANNTFAMPSANITLTAQWGPVTFVITYDANGGSGSASLTSDSFVNGSPAIGLPTVGSMAKAGYTFAGWSETNTVSATLIVGAYAPIKTITLYAQWSPGTFTINYNDNGGTGTSTGAATYTTGTTGIALSAVTGVTKSGYVLSGWAATASGTALSSPYSPTTNVTLYAVWSPAPVAVNYVANIVPVSGAVAIPANTTKPYGTTFAILAPDSATVTSASGDYAFAGWSDNASIYSANATYLVGVNTITLTAQWVRIYTLHYVLNGGTAVSAGDFPDIQYLNNQIVAISAAAPTRTGYHFDGWVDQSASSVTQGQASYTIGDTHYILTAQWTPISYAITYDCAGGSAVTPATGTIGQIFGLATAPTKTGYNFNGWRDASLTFGASAAYAMPAAAVAFTAQWSPISFSVAYDLNGGTSSAITGTSAAYNSQFNVTTTVPTRSGYTFNGWLYTTNYPANALFTMPANNVTFTAQWTTASFTATYVLNGGTSIVPSPTVAAFGGTFALPATPTYVNHTFLGWNDGTSSYAAGTTYSMKAANVTFDAVWSGATYAVTYSLSGGSGTIPTSQTSAAAISISLAASGGFSKSGFTFSAWSDGTTTYPASSSFTVPTHNTALIAVWIVAVPATPTAPTAVAGNGQATITLGNPAATGGGAVATYTITANPGGAICTVTSPATSCVITGLANGTAYTFTSTANNSTGSSSASTPSAAVTPATVPDYPINITAVPGRASATVSFDPPLNNGGSPITSYIVTATSGQSCTVAASANPLQCTITGLTNGVPVDFVIVSYNAVGASIPSPDPTITPADVPGAPASVSAVSTSGTSASVTVTAPASDGGNPITTYTVTATSSTGVAVTKTVTAAQITSAIVMTGLTPGATYSFTAVATNQVGAGAGRTSSAVNQPAVPPSAPAITSVTAGTITTETINILAPSSTGGSAITGYVATMTPVGGGAPVVLTANSTTLSAAGLNPGTTYTVVVAASNSAGNSPASTSTTFTTPLAVGTSVPSLSGTFGTPITSINTSISGANPSGTTYSVSPGLPAGLTLNTSTGVISGTPTSAIASTSYTIAASTTVSGGATTSGSTTVTIGVAAVLPGAPSTVSANPITSSTASVRITAPSSNGGSAITKYTISAAPVGGGTVITQDAASITSPVTLTGLTDSTSYTISVTATNAIGAGPATIGSGTLTTPSPTPTITSVSPTTGSGAGGTTVTITGTNLVTGATVAFDGNPCTISGTPTTTSISCVTPAGAVGPADVVVTTPDSQQATALAVFTYYAPVSAATAITSKAIEVGVAVTSFIPVTSAGGKSPITYSISPSLPASLSFNTSTGAITGTLIAALVSTTYTVTASDSSMVVATSSSTFTLTGNLALVAGGTSTPVTMTAGVASTPFTPVTTSNGVSPVTYSVSPSLPAGLTLNPATGEITGTPTSASISGTYTVTATDAAGGSSHADFTLEVLPAPLVTTTAVTTTSLTQNSAITSFTPVTVAGGTAPLTYSISPALPAGLTLNPATGAINGTPTGTISSTSFTITATDSSSPAQTATSTFTLEVLAAAAPPVTPTAPPAVVMPAPAVTPTPTPSPTPMPVVTPTPAPVVTPPVVKPTPAPVVTPPVVKPTPAPVVTPPVVKPTPAPVVTPPVVKPTPAPVVTPPVVKPTPAPVVTPPVVKPTPAPVVTPPVVKPTPKPSPTTAKVLEITPKLSSKSAAVVLSNLQPGQKLKVTIIEGKQMTPTSKPSSSPSKKSDIQIAPKTSGNSAKFGVTNLKPGQKIKITIKDGTKK